MFIIAEIGTSHGGNIKKAFELIDAACYGGADMVKFQWVYADEILHPLTGTVNLPGGSIPLYDSFKNLECDSDFYRQCMDYAHSKGLLFGCSPFGEKSFDELAALSPDAIKIASPEVNHYPLLKKCSTIYGKIPLILSSGVSKLGDIEKAVEIITQNKTADTWNNKIPPLTLLHCVTFYPAPEEEYNVRCISSLSSVFGLPCGISDHSLDPVLVPVLSALCGGTMIEKHITLSKKTDGLDDPVALEPDQFALMSHSVGQACAVINKYAKEGLDIHCAEKEILRQLEYEWPRKKLMAIIGDGIKKMSISEIANYGRTNRSLHYTKGLEKGHVISKEDVAVLRTEKILNPGISPEYLDLICGKILTKDIENGQGVAFEDFMNS